MISFSLFFLVYSSIFDSSSGFAQSAKIPSVLPLVNTAKKVDPQTLATKAAVCFSCHGENGISPNSVWPNLAGQKQEYLVKQLLAFKKGTRQDPTMNPVAETLSEQQIQDVTLYFTSQNFTSQNSASQLPCKN